MRIFVDTASLAEIEEWAAHPWVSGFTTNPTLYKDFGYHERYAREWAEQAVAATGGKPISIDGPDEVARLGHNVWRKVVGWSNLYCRNNLTAVCTLVQLPDGEVDPQAIISVFAGRILDTGRDPRFVIDAAKATGAQVLWASAREPYHVVMAEAAGCDIITLTPTILQKWLDFNGMPLEALAEQTVAQFDRDREGLW